VKTLGIINNTRQIANTLVSIVGAPGNPALNSATIYQTFLAEGKIACGTPPAGQNACISAGDLTQFGGGSDAVRPQRHQYVSGANIEVCTLRRLERQSFMQ
jgi:hypothetical protein